MWFPFLYTGTDTQPYAFAVSVIVILYYYFVKKEKTYPKAILLLLLVCVLVGVYAMWDIPDYGFAYVIKRYVMYMSIVAIPEAVFLVMKANAGVNENLIKLCIWLWFFSGVIQRTVKPDFAGQFVARQSTSLIRGVVGFATEPSAYGFWALFVLVMALTFQKHRILYIGLLIVQILGLAQSSVTLIYLGVYFAGYLLNEILLGKRFALLKTVGLSAGVLGLLYFAYQKSLLPTRMYLILRLVLEGSWEKLRMDESISERIGGITQSIADFISNRGIPQGFGGERYFSGVGILLVEGGFLSVVILCILGILIGRAYPRRYRFLFVFGFMVTMMSSIPFSSPIVCMYLGYCVYQGEKRRAAGIHMDERWKVILNET
jgi:hypothetical protein